MGCSGEGVASGADGAAGFDLRARFRRIVCTVLIITSAKRMPAAFQVTAAQPLVLLIIVAARSNRASSMPTRISWGRLACERSRPSTPVSSSLARNVTNATRTAAMTTEIARAVVMRSQ
jgi:hypothetical protein